MINQTVLTHSQIRYHCGNRSDLLRINRSIFLAFVTASTSSDHAPINHYCFGTPEISDTTANASTNDSKYDSNNNSRHASWRRPISFTAIILISWETFIWFVTIILVQVIVLLIVAKIAIITEGITGKNLFVIVITRDRLVLIVT